MNLAHVSQPKEAYLTKIGYTVDLLLSGSSKMLYLSFSVDIATRQG